MRTALIATLVLLVPNVALADAGDAGEEAAVVDAATEAGCTTDCAPYACAGTSCKTSCAKAADCAAPYLCDVAVGRCVSVARCDGASTAVSADGARVDCTPYACAGGVCRTTCSKDDDCTTGKKCFYDQHRCEDPSWSPPSPDDSGCSFGHGGGSAFILGLCAAIGLAARTRRRS